MEINKKNIVKSLLLSSLALGLFVTANNASANASTTNNIKTAKVNNNQKTIIIKYGDTVSEYAVKYNSTVKDIAEANHLANANLIYAGNKIIIPVNSRVAGQSIYDGWNTNNQGNGTVKAKTVAVQTIATPNNKVQTATKESTPVQKTNTQISMPQQSTGIANQSPAASVVASQATANQATANQTPASQTPASQTPASQTPASQTPADPSAFTPTEAGVRAALQAKLSAFGKPAVHKVQFDGTTTGTLSGALDGDVSMIHSDQQVADMMWENSNASLIQNSLDQIIGLSLQSVSVNTTNGKMHASFTVAYQEK